MWKWNNILLKYQWAKNEITRKMRKYLEINEKKTKHSNSKRCSKPMHRGKFIAVNISI